MSPTQTFRARLANADPAALRDPGPAGEELRRSLLVGARIGVIEPGLRHEALPLRAGARATASSSSSSAIPRAGRERSSTRGSRREFVAADTSGEPDDGARGGARRARRGRQNGWTASSRSGRTRCRRRRGSPRRSGCRDSRRSAADAARSKLRTLEASRAAGLPTPRFVRLEGPESLAAAAA